MEIGSKAAIERMKKADHKLPQFLYVHYLDPHDPWPYRKKCDSYLPYHTPSRPAVKNGQTFILSGESAITNVRFSKEKPHPMPLEYGDFGYVKGLYDCEVSLVDDAVGQLLDYLDEHYWLDNAIVILTSDHGEEFREHGMLRMDISYTIRSPMCRL